MFLSFLLSKIWASSIVEDFLFPIIFHYTLRYCYVNLFYRTDKVILDRNLSAVANLRSEIFMLEKELTKQKVKCRALEEELQNPLNIHRWRKLEVRSSRLNLY